MFKLFFLFALVGCALGFFLGALAVKNDARLEKDTEYKRGYYEGYMFCLDAEKDNVIRR